MRLFTAIEVGAAVRTAGGALIAELQERVRRRAPGARVTWVGTDRLHLTLRFIGEVDDARGEAIVRALREPVPCAPFVARWTGLGAFPGRGAPRVLWVGAADGRDALVRLEGEVSARLLGVGVPGEGRPYTPHLTLGRVREPDGLRVPALFEGLDGDLGTTTVDDVTLFRSTLSPKGPTYTVLQRTPLRAP